MIVVADAGPIIHLSRVGCVDLLPVLYHRLLIPTAVYDEIVLKGAGLAGSTELRGAPWADLVGHEPDAEMFLRLRSRLDVGEAAAICLASERSADLILSDDREARDLARQMGFKVQGTVGILIEGKRRGQLPYLAPLLSDLKRKGTWLSDAFIQSVLRTVGEIDPERE